MYLYKRDCKLCMSVDMKISLDVWHGKCHLMGSLTIKTKGYVKIILCLRGLQHDINKRSGHKTDVKPKVSNQ